MQTLGAYLSLQDPDRSTLQPDPERDPDLYVDLDSLLPRLRQGLSRRAPKALIMGDYGTGKTHLLHRLKAREMDPERFEAVYVKLEAHGPAGTSRHLHDDIVCALEGQGVLGAALSEPYQGQDTDVRRAFEVLRTDPTNPDIRAWLLGRGPTATQSRRLGFSARLSDIAGGVKYAQIWKDIGEGYRKATGKELMLLIDESETFQEVLKPGRLVELGVAIRELFDTTNKSVGVFLGLTAPKARGLAHPLTRPDVVTRTQDVTYHLGRPDTPERLHQFYATLLAALLKSTDSFLTPSALRTFCEQAPDRARLDLVGINRAPVQREFVKLLDQFAHECLHQQRKLPIEQTALTVRAAA